MKLINFRFHLNQLEFLKKFSLIPTLNYGRLPSLSNPKWMFDNTHREFFVVGFDYEGRTKNDTLLVFMHPEGSYLLYCSAPDPRAPWSSTLNPYIMGQQQRIPMHWNTVWQRPFIIVELTIKAWVESGGNNNGKEIIKLKPPADSTPYQPHIHSPKPRGWWWKRGKAPLEGFVEGDSSSIYRWSPHSLEKPDPNKTSAAMELNSKPALHPHHPGVSVVGR